MTTPGKESMYRDDHDPLIDPCLEELLGGEQPPDLSARILRALAARAAAGTGPAGSPIAGPAPAPAVLANGSHPGADRVVPIAAASIAAASIVGANGSSMAATERANRLARASRGRQRMAMAAAASIALVASGFWAVRQLAPGSGGVGEPARPQESAAGDRIARRPAADRSTVDASSKGQSIGSPRKTGPRTSGGPSAMASNQADAESAPAAASQLTGNQLTGNQLPAPPGDAVASGPKPGPVQQTDDLPGGEPSLASRSAASDGSPNLASRNNHPDSVGSDTQLVAFIDSMLLRAWRDAGVGPSPPATDAEWCRRVYLDVVGRIPSIQELEAFLADHSPGKRTALVDRLLGEEYIEEYARHWASTWTNTLVGRNGGEAPGSLVNRQGLLQYLRRAILHNKPYDRMVFELISAQGANTPGEEDFNGAVNFLLDHLQQDGITATAKTGEIFLGVQIQCTQCHNHPFNDWQQGQFWGLNAFFRQARAVSSMQRGMPAAARLEDADFAGELGDVREAEIFYELRNGEMRTAYPTFIDGTVINPNGMVAEVNRRHELARLVVDSPYLGKALVNRFWEHFFGYGFTRPVTDMGPHNAPSHPELLDRLGSEFSATGHDLKRLSRVILLSRAYALSSRFGAKYRNEGDDPSLGTPPLFSHFYPRQITAEQLYDSLVTVTQAHRVQGNFEEQQRTKQEWLEQFTIAFGTDDNGESTTFDGTITQALMMMNGELTRRATTAQEGTFLHEVATRPQGGHVQRLYLAALARKPSKGELELAGRLMASRREAPVTALEDMWWALLNSNEFILNH